MDPEILEEEKEEVTELSREIIKLLKTDETRKLALKVLEKSQNKTLYYMLLDSKSINVHEYEFNF